MLKRKTLGSCLLNVQSTPKVISSFKKGFFSRVHDCVLRCSTRELLIKEVHGGSLAGHYGKNKTLIMLREQS